MRAVNNVVERGNEGKAAGRVREGLAHDAGRGFPLII